MIFRFLREFQHFEFVFKISFFKIVKNSTNIFLKMSPKFKCFTNKQMFSETNIRDDEAWIWPGVVSGSTRKGPLPIDEGGH